MSNLLFYIAGIKIRVMNQVLEKRSNTVSSSGKGKFDLEAKMKMSPDEQNEYMKLHWDEIDASVRALDKKLEGCERLVTDEDEIADIVSKYRRERYEASLRH